MIDKNSSKTLVGGNLTTIKVCIKLFESEIETCVGKEFPIEDKGTGCKVEKNGKTL